MSEDWREEAEKCALTQQGVDTNIGAYFSTPCGWSTYNGWDISHSEWHRRGLAYCSHSKLALSKTRTCDGTKVRCPDCRSFRSVEELKNNCAHERVGQSVDGKRVLRASGNMVVPSTMCPDCGEWVPDKLDES